MITFAPMLSYVLYGMLIIIGALLHRWTRDNGQP